MSFFRYLIYFILFEIQHSIGGIRLETIKIVHCADFHFDTPFIGLPAVKAAARQEDLKLSFSKVVEETKKMDADVFLICGDLFDNDSIVRSTIEFITKKLSEIPNTRVFISPGNHDPFTDSSYYSLIEWPSNVHIFSSEDIECIDINELNACVYGVGFHTKHISNSLIKGFKVHDTSKINIMAMHGTVRDTPFFENAYNPIDINEIEYSGLDYLALGHVHSYSNIKKYGSTYWAYSGNTEGRSFGECGHRGFLYGTVGKGVCDIDFKKINQKEYRRLKIDVSDMPMAEELFKRVEDEFDAKQCANILARIELTGRVEMYFREIKPEKILMDKFGDIFYYLEVVDNTEINYNIREIAKMERSIQRSFAQKILNLIETEQDVDKIKMLEEAFYMGIQALNGKEDF